MLITPTRRLQDLKHPLTFDDYIDIFYERLYGWHLHIAEQMVRPITQENGETIDRTIPHCEYAVLQIVMSYFETIAKYHDGFAQSGQSERYFKRGMRMVMGVELVPESEGIDNILDALYDRARNSLYHTTSAVGISFGDQPFLIIGMVEGRNDIIINVKSVMMILIKDLRDYCARLRDPGEVELREKFLRRFEFDMQAPQPIP